MGYDYERWKFEDVWLCVRRGFSEGDRLKGRNIFL